MASGSRSTNSASRTQPDIDLKVGSWYVSTHPSSHFVTNLMAALVTDDARYNLADGNLAIHRADGTEKVLLTDAAAVVDTLSDRFGINVDDVGERGTLEARIDRLLSRQPGPDSPQGFFDVARRSGERQPDERVAALGVEVDARRDGNTGVGQQL